MLESYAATNVSGVTYGAKGHQLLPLGPLPNSTGADKRRLQFSLIETDLRAVGCPFNHPRRTQRPGHTAGSRLTTPARAASRRLSAGKDDVSEISGANIGMDVDEEDTIERGLKYETIFAKSEELQVTFYAHLPAEVKLVLRNAGA